MSKRNIYVATLSLRDGSTVKIEFKSQATRTGTVRDHAYDAAAKAGYFAADGVVVERVVPAL